MMPGQGGYEFLRSLQGSLSGRIPIFVVTGSALDDSTIKMIRAEANVIEFIAKPVKMAKFVAALHKTLKTRPRECLAAFNTETQRHGPVVDLRR